VTTSGGCASRHRSLGLGNTNPPDFLHSPGSDRLLTRRPPADRHTKASTSAIDVFWVGARGVLGKTVVANSSTSPVPFAFTFDPGVAWWSSRRR